MGSGDEWLTALAERMKAQRASGLPPRRVSLTIRQLLSKYNYDRRGAWIDKVISNKIDDLGMRSIPRFDDRSISLDERISIDLVQNDVRREHDPTHRVGILPAASKKPLSVTPNDELTAAKTKMMINDYSQLPVMQNDRHLRGIISWSSIGRREQLGIPCNYVRDCMDQPAVEVGKDTPLLDAVGIIVKSGYVLVRDRQQGNTISGIVTATDLSSQFVQLAGPFLLAGQIEGHLRNLVEGKIAADQLEVTAVRAEGDKQVTEAADLTLGDYCRLLGRSQHWDSLELQVDRSEFVKHLEAVRTIRNNIMHFRPEQISSGDLQTLRDVARFFEDLANMGVM